MPADMQNIAETPAPEAPASPPSDADLVYRCICRALSGQPADSWPELSGPEWAFLEKVAAQEGVGPLLYWNFRKAGWPEKIPLKMIKSLTDSYYHNVAQNTLLYHELARILDAFQAAHIPVIVLKGAVLAAMHYPDIGLRPMGDLDLLVPLELLEAGEETLRQCGFTLEESLQGLPLGLRKLIHYEANYDGGEQMPVHVELHWSLIGGQESVYQPQIAWFWEQSRVQDVGGLAMRVLNPGAHLLYLAAHLSLKHSGAQERLIWYVDVDLLARQEAVSLDWDGLHDREQDFGWGGALDRTLAGAALRFGTPLPPGILETSTENQQPFPARARRKSPLAGTLQELRTLRGWARVRLAVALLFPHPAYIRYRYQPQPAWLWPLMYPYRWGNILIQVLSVFRNTYEH